MESLPLDEVQELIKKSHLEIEEDLNKVGPIIEEWVNTLPPVKKELLSEEFRTAIELFSSPTFFKHFKKSHDPFADESLQEMLKISDETMQTFYQMGYDLHQKGESEKARAIFRFLTILNPLAVDFWIGLGIVFLIESRTFDAQATFSIARSIDPENPEPCYYISRCLFMQGLLPEALKSSHEAERLSKIQLNTPCLKASLDLITQIQQKLKK